ncbi:MAG: helix-turn-helix domain-containing protein [Bacteroidetes bacterium]|nr:helix-turn-helix domain-containing protein [Bacteroidota bacterium]
MRVKIEKSLPEKFLMQRHLPEPMECLHTHGHVEILLPVGCHLTYVTQLGNSVAPSGHISVLWGQTPHRLITVDHENHDQGEILIANLPLSEMLSWSMPEIFMAQLFSGRLIVGDTADPANFSCFARWHADYSTGNNELTDVARQELQLCLLRQSLCGWRHDGVEAPLTVNPPQRQARRVQAMIRYMAENYRLPTTVADIAAEAGISKGHAMTLFQKQMNTSMISYLNELRLRHAQSALANSNEKIVNIAFDAGFGSMSQFYEVFQRATGDSPQVWRNSQH